VNYQWDPHKAAANLKKHKVDFADAVGIFKDPFAITFRMTVTRRPASLLLEQTFWGGSWLLLIPGEGKPEDYHGARSPTQRAPPIRGMMHMAEEYDFSKGKRGAIVSAAHGKTRITISPGR